MSGLRHDQRPSNHYCIIVSSHHLLRLGSIKLKGSQVPNLNIYKGFNTTYTRRFI
jgi:hypothetical protein